MIGDALWDDSSGDFTVDGINHHMPLKTIYELEKFRVDMQNLTGGRGGQCDVFLWISFGRLKGVILTLYSGILLNRTSYRVSSRELCLNLNRRLL